MSAAPSPTTDVVERIQLSLGSLSDGERRVAWVVLNDVPATVESTISQLAARAEISATTVTRFCKSIGLSGYPQLRRQLAASLARRRSEGETANHIPALEHISPDDTPDDVVRKLATASMRAIEHTAARIDIDELGRAVDSLMRARRVLVYAVGTSISVAVDAAFKLNLVDCSTVRCADSREAAMYATRCTSDDVALVISHSGHARETVDFAHLATANGALVIAITSDATSATAKAADVVLLSSAHEIIGIDTGGISSRIALLTVVDAIFLSLAQRTYDVSFRAAEAMVAAVQPYIVGSRSRSRMSRTGGGSG